jgi:hypothetical protein
MDGKWCGDFRYGRCTRGASCKFAHVLPLRASADDANKASSSGRASAETLADSREKLVPEKTSAAGEAGCSAGAEYMKKKQAEATRLRDLESRAETTRRQGGISPTALGRVSSYGGHEVATAAASRSPTSSFAILAAVVALGTLTNADR